MIFPGMDPFLENAFLWRGAHTLLIAYICEQLQPLLQPRYFAAIEERVFVEGSEQERVPDVWIRRKGKPGRFTATLEAEAPIVVQVPEMETSETYLEIRDRFKKQKLVTSIEVVSFTNKYAGPGRDSYLSKQREVRESQAHLVEIDLLRAGQHVLAVPERFARQSADYRYLMCVNRAGDVRDHDDLYPKRLEDPLPRMSIPVANGDPDVVLDLQAALGRVFEAGAYASRLDYDQPCPSPLSPEERSWVRKTLRKAGVKVR